MADVRSRSRSAAGREDARPAALAPVLVVGMGDDGPAGLSPAARTAVADATLLCGGDRHLAFFPEHPAERFVVRANLAELVDRLAARDAAERPVVLASGDPCYFGIAPYLAARLGRDRVRVEPHVSSVQLAFARLCVGWHDALVLSAHGRPLAPLLPRALGAPKVVFLTDERNTPAAIAEALLAAGQPDCEAHVFEHLGGAAERHTACRLVDLPPQRFAALNVLVLLRDANGSPAAGFGRPESAYAHRDGQITKAEVRAVSLSKLRLRPGAIVWDVGAGCGSVSLEAAALVPGGRVYAVERDPAQRALLQANAVAHPTTALAVIAGEAPEALAALPDPDAVFLGGSGGRLAALLACIADRLRPRGRLVANFATVEHVAEATAWLRAAGWEHELVQLSAARGADLAGLTRLAPLPPVFVLTGWRARDDGSRE
ncbi:MAG TPA: precorrin-6y C5,15-methyltransferase (decarboxylating) subunit CbiE [Chloroflexota bacterium]|nr:precorrin-6y C5,15-methyltransferase (decarboxylating) subunit CbiE [Chloroflexota bacterium]